MTAPTGPIFPFGLRNARLYALNANGTPAAVDTTPYEGIFIKNAVAFEVSIPEPRKITGNGEDGVTVTAFLPPLEGVSASLNVEATDPSLAALVDDTLARTLGGATLVGVATNNQGFEPIVGLLLTQAHRIISTGAKGWHSYILPSAQVVRQASGMSADKGVTRYSVSPNVTSKHLWGETMTDLVDGYTRAQMVEMWTNNPPTLTAFVGTGSEDEFVYPATAPSAASFATTTIVFVDDVKQTSGVTIAADKITFSVAPASGARIVVFRELA